MSRTLITGLLDRQTQLVKLALDNGLFDAQDIANLDHQNVQEWLLVSDALAAKLAEDGHVILSNEYGTWWGCESLEHLTNLR
jgi:hypothetical protein